MATNNGLTLAAKTCDIEIENAAGDVYGFSIVASAPTIPESGASQITASTGESTPTFRSAEPFETLEYTDWSYGMGQVNGDRAEGGLLGQGGNPAMYFYGDCFTLRTGKLLPGMARDLVYNTVSAAVKTPIADGLDPVAGDEYEVPRGVLPALVTAGAFLTSPLTVSNPNPTVTNVRLLCQFTNPASAGTVTVTAVIQSSTYSLAINKSTFGNYTGWKWITLPKTAGTGVLIAGSGSSVTVSFTDGSSDPDSVTIGCWAYTQSNVDYLAPYFQLMTSATPFKYWANPVAKFEQLNNGGTYVNVAVTTNAIFNTANTGSAGTAGTSPERTFSAGNVYTGSIVFNNQLYVGQYNVGAGTGATQMWNAPAAAANAAATNSNVFTLGPATQDGGYIYYIDGATQFSLFRWDGAFPGTATQVITAGKIGQAGTIMNNLAIFQGSLYVFKPEGVFKIVSAMSDLSTAKTPTIIQVWSPPGGVLGAALGKWVCEHQGKLYFNWRNLVVELVMQEDKPTITYYNPNPPWYRQSYYNYVNGITSDGQNLYASVNNFGISAYNSFGWHPITEFYEQVAVEGQSSGLRWLPNPTGAPDYLFCGDGNTLLKIPIPNNFQPYTSQIYQNHQNKCGYIIMPEWTGSLAEAEKNLRSVILRAIPNGWSYKLVAVVQQAGDATSFNNLMVKTFKQGLSRSRWTGLLPAANYNYGYIVTTLVSIAGFTATPVANTLAPGCWKPADFANSLYQSKKLAVATTDTTTTPNKTENVTNPVKVAKTQFILYFWNPVTGQAATTGTEVMSVDTVVIKHFPKLKYVARYQVALDLSALARIGTVPKTPAQVNVSAKWLRNAWVARDPLYFRFYDVTGAIVQVEGIIQGNHNDVFPLDKGHTALFGGRVDFSILSMTEEDPT